MSNYFHGRHLIITSKHEKQRVIAPVLERLLGVKCVLNLDFDTDSLGTFSGEIERKDDALTTLRKKCEEGFKDNNYDLALATEGSFGPHPYFPFIAGHEEIILLIDRSQGLEILARDLTTDTNFDSISLTSEEELLSFAEKSGFPDHALILRPNKNSIKPIYKGINSLNLLITKYRELRETYGEVYVETDMRAMHNPMRLAFIEKLSEKLALKALSTCPKCQTPGFSVTESIQGLPCEYCGQPTRSVLSHLMNCTHCGFQKEIPFPNGKQTEDPMYCDFCNP
ncbi:DUF6671 family protein [Cecembia rubra]|uniref:DUF6671 domain-containing protein n=1 Tax=Cecembia rubra TaxID=1485585 RepID=A0A2P8E2U6_9BACT|nr:DUF6671 family protein [Cecembia rubra]PSL03785.1 hypothetical protein CLV48_10624 [Cecembia rubra]